MFFFEFLSFSKTLTSSTSCFVCVFSSGALKGRFLEDEIVIVQ